MNRQLNLAYYITAQHHFLQYDIMLLQTRASYKVSSLQQKHNYIWHLPMYRQMSQ